MMRKKMSPAANGIDVPIADTKERCPTLLPLGLPAELDPRRGHEQLQPELYDGPAHRCRDAPVREEGSLDSTGRRLIAERYETIVR